MALLRIRTELVAFYPAWHRAHQGHHSTHARDLTPKMVGMSGIQKLKLKALECYGFCIFLVSLLERHGQHVANAVDLHRAIESGRVMLEYVRVLKTAADRSVNLTDEEHPATQFLVKIIHVLYFQYKIIDNLASYAILKIKVIMI